MSAAAEFFSETVNTTGKVAKNLPAGQMANVQVTVDTSIEFWNPAIGSDGGYGAPETLEAPGGQVYCPNARARFKAIAGDSDVTVTLLSL